jgi:membrane-bound serine protease (ClpP class)
LFTGITNPDLAFLLLAFGVFSIYVEFSRPGLVLPGVLGATLSLIALSGLARFSVTLPGVLLVFLALAMFVLEALVSTRGVLMLAGIAAMVKGSLLLIDTTDPALRIHPNIAFAVTIPFALVTTLLLSIAIRARRNKSVTSAPALAHRPGLAR